jgi:hypothetical protein
MFLQYEVEQHSGHLAFFNAASTIIDPTYLLRARGEVASRVFSSVVRKTGDMPSPFFGRRRFFSEILHKGVLNQIANWSPLFNGRRFASRIMSSSISVPIFFS